jgi:hypothetical protein
VHSTTGATRSHGTGFVMWVSHRSQPLCTERETAASEALLTTPMPYRRATPPTRALVCTLRSFRVSIGIQLLDALRRLGSVNPAVPVSIGYVTLLHTKWHRV